MSRINNLAFTRSTSYGSTASDIDDDAQSYYSGDTHHHNNVDGDTTETLITSHSPNDQHRNNTHRGTPDGSITLPGTHNQPAQCSSRRGRGVDSAINGRQCQGTKAFGYDKSRLGSYEDAHPNYIPEDSPNNTHDNDSQHCSSRNKYRCNFVALVLFIVIVSGGIATGVSFVIYHAELHKNNFVVSPGECDEWSPWGSCSVTCGLGVQTKNRTCYGNETQSWVNTFTDSKYCSEPICIDAWTDWGPWGACSVSCGAGMRIRNRTCTGHFCGDSDIDKDVCSDVVCIDAWSDWNSWSSCSVTCGTGSRTRDRTCTGKYCGDNNMDMDLCYNHICKGTWSDWNSWGSCSVTCGCGLKSRDRTCQGEVCGPNMYDYIACTQTACGGGGGGGGGGDVNGGVSVSKSSTPSNTVLFISGCLLHMCTGWH